MNSSNWTPQEETQLAEYLVTRIRARAAGRIDDECIRNYPRDVYFIGNLRPRPQESNDIASESAPPYLRELLSKLAPVAFGAEFLFKPEAEVVIITVGVKWSCYHRVFPIWAQQREHQQQQTVRDDNDDVAAEKANTQRQREEKAIGPSEPTVSIGDGEEPTETEGDILAEDEQRDQQAEQDSPEVAESTRDRRRSRVPQDSLFIRFRKISCQAKGQVVLRRDTAGKWTADISELRAALDQETTRAQQVAINDPERIRTTGASEERIRVPETALASATDFAQFVQSLSNDVVPTWRWEVRTEIRRNEAADDQESRMLLLEFTNASPMLERSPNTEAFLFDAEATFSFSGAQAMPFELELAPRGFRYDRNLWGRGFNCSVETIPLAASTFRTTHTPIYRQMRYNTRTDPPAAFEDLARNPVPILEAIYNAMCTYRQEWDQTRLRYVQADPNWESEFSAEFDTDRQKFEEEIERFRRGYLLIRDNADVRLAFQLTNETFRRGPKPGWRLFQIVFLVSGIPGIAALANPDSPDADELEKVDIIYFPTGGGKTEAYLAILVFHCFFDRLRGKTAGVTAWTRFPLRLLTLQQTQRVADAICMAELIRREQVDPRLNGLDVDGFAVGYLVGREATPNELTPPFTGRMPDPAWSQAQDQTARQKWKRLIRCPSCSTATVRVDFDQRRVSVVHRCMQKNCAFPSGIIPCYVVDNEIYRYLPSVIVGTIDKLASVGNQRKLSQIFGQVDGRCTEHGYFKGKCCQKNCTDRQRLQANAPLGLSGPTLFIQDELHLLKEGLGTFDSHYETFTQRLRREFGQEEPLKIIASSATIEAFERQVEHLYGRTQGQARVFPGPSPTLGQSFYAETLDYPQRLFVGILPHNKTIFNTILELIDYYHREVQDLQRLTGSMPNPYGGMVSPDSGEWQDLLDFYSTSLSYFLANRELNSIRTDLEGDVNPNLLRDGYLPLGIPELTGSTGTDEVTRILERLETSAKSNMSPDAVLATSMVSHGVDVNRLNSMIFYGMPRQNAEYIQASSRVGRSRVGVVFACLHPARERDQSHYAYFTKFHEFLGQLVEPVAINRWSKFSVNRTLPGLFMGVLLQLLANRSGESNPNRYYMLDFVKQKISDGTIQPDDFIPLLEEAYQVKGVSDVGPDTFREEIRLRVEQFLYDQILSAGTQQPFVSGALIPAPMMSLREVDEQLDIELDSAGTDWTNRASR